jgi:hypothetical protein
MENKVFYCLSLKFLFTVCSAPEKNGEKFQNLRAVLLYEKTFSITFVPFLESFPKKIGQRKKLTNSIQELRNPHMIILLKIIWSLTTATMII